MDIPGLSLDVPLQDTTKCIKEVSAIAAPSIASVEVVGEKSPAQPRPVWCVVVTLSAQQTGYAEAQERRMGLSRAKERALAPFANRCPKAAVGEGFPTAGVGVPTWTHVANGEGNCPPPCGPDTEQ